MRGISIAVLLVCPCLWVCQLSAQDVENSSGESNGIDPVEINVEDLFENSLYLSTGESGVSIHKPKFVEVAGRLFVTSRDGRTEDGIPNVSLVAWESVHTIHVRGVNPLVASGEPGNVEAVEMKTINPEHYYRIELQKLHQQRQQIHRKVQLIDAFVKRTDREIMDLNVLIEQQEDMEAVKRIEKKIDNRKEQLEIVAGQKEAEEGKFEEIDEKLEELRHEAVLNGVIPTR